MGRNHGDRPMHFDSFQLAHEKFLKQEDRVIRDFGFGATKDAISIIQRHISRATEVVQEKLASTSRSSMKDICDTISILTPEKIALVALQGGMDCIASQENLDRTCHILGDLLSQELYAQGLVDFDKKLAARLDDRVRRRGSSSKVRKTALKAMAGKKGYRFEGWDHETKSRAGMWLVEVLAELEDVFVVVRVDEKFAASHSYLTLTQEALDYSQAFVRHLLEVRPVPLPQLSPPAAWTGLSLDLESNGRTYTVPLVRKAGRGLTGVYLKQALDEGRLQPVLDALTRASSVAWRINPAIRDLVVWAYENDVEVEGLPSRKDLPIPDRLPNDEWEAMTDDQKLLRRKELSNLMARNRALLGEREVLKADLACADVLLEKGNRFWTPMNMDYRGRVYSVCYFNFQRQDYVRGMFEFAEGKPLGDHGLYWLKVHLANCGDFGKVSKAPFEDRVKWVDDNLERIFDMTTDPMQDLWWTEADSPFLFIAAAIDLCRALVRSNPAEYVSHIPVSFDGSCSGLQHLAAMTRCETTARFVNLTTNERPSDIYQTVADAVKAKVEVVTDGEFSEVAAKALAYGIDRSLVKRNVMTWAYSSKKFGMTQQLVEDTMLPLKDKVTAGKLPVHPFAVEKDRFPGQTAAKFLGALTFDTIEEVVQRPAEAMEYLQKIARALAHEGKPVVWHTPLGFPVVLHYPNLKSNKIRMWMQDRGVNVKVQCTHVEEAPGIDKTRAANAVAPGFVHSYDACHLQMVVNEAWAQGIEYVALVHDSFGCLAGDAQAFRSCITGTFHRLYSENDVLDMIRQETCAQIHSNHHRIPSRSDVSTGAYDLNDITEALYAFA